MYESLFVDMVSPSDKSDQQHCNVSIDCLVNNLFLQLMSRYQFLHWHC